jgi:hypothetical protein
MLSRYYLFILHLADEGGGEQEGGMSPSSHANSLVLRQSHASAIKAAAITKRASLQASAQARASLGEAFLGVGVGDENEDVNAEGVSTKGSYSTRNSTGGVGASTVTLKQGNQVEGKRSSLPCEASHCSSSTQEAPRTERMQQIFESLSKARSDTLTRVKRVSSSIFKGTVANTRRSLD